MTPEVLVNAGVPCCRLVQNAGEFVVTFPRAYHTGFSHGFNCGEAVNFATPEWLRIAREAAIRRALTNRDPMLSHTQLHYDLAMSLSSSLSRSTSHEPRSSRLKGRLKDKGETLVKRLFLQDMVQNNQLLHALCKGSPIVPLSGDALDDGYGSQANASPRLSLGTGIEDDEMESLESSDSDGSSLGERPRRRKNSSFDNQGTSIEKHDEKPNPASMFSCVTCGVLCYACVAIIQPTKEATRYLMSQGITDLDATNNLSASNKYANMVNPKSSSLEGQMPKSAHDRKQVLGDRVGTSSLTGAQKVNSSLDLLALTYGVSSDSDEDLDCPRIDIEDTSDQTSYTKYCMASSSMGRLHSIKVSRGKAITPVHKWPVNPVEDEDSLKTHVFCLQHAAKVEQCHRSIGGVYMLLLCHQDYPKLEAEARLVVKELGTDHVLADLEYREAIDQDKKMIQSALDDDKDTHGNQDWTVVLGINLSYSASISRSPFYRTQMHYNLVIYDAFEHSSSSGDSLKAKPLGKKKKSTVADKWCGKVWMSNQVHPFLVARDVEEQHHDENVGVLDLKVGVQLERRSQGTKAVRKRKKNAATERKPTTAKANSSKVASSPPPPPPPAADDFRWQNRTIRRSEQTRKGTTTHPRTEKIAWKFDAVSKDHFPEVASSPPLALPPPPAPAPAPADDLPLDSGFSQQNRTIRRSKRIKNGTITHPRTVVKKKAREFDTVSRDNFSELASSPSPPPPQVDDLLLDGGFRRQNRSFCRSKQIKKGTATHPRTVVEKKAQEFNTISKDDGPTRCLERRIITPPARYLEVGIESKPRMKHRYRRTKNVKKAHAVEVPEEEHEFDCIIDGCTMSFNTALDLLVHSENMCHVKGCGKKFASHKYLMTHRRVHTTERPLKCTWEGCSKAFKWKWSVTEHLRVHTGERPYKCTVEGCGLTFRFVSDFCRHKRTSGHLRAGGS